MKKEEIIEELYALLNNEDKNLAEMTCKALSEAIEIIRKSEVE